MPPLSPSKYAILSPYRISDQEFNALRGMIAALSGIHIAENRKYLLQNRLSPRLRELGLKDFSEYARILRGADRMAEISRLLELATTNETSFYRNPPQIDYFQNVLLPEAAEAARGSGRKKLRIFSAGCSSGEEPYTAAIVIMETLGAELSSWDVKVTAADLSEAMLQEAREGLYDEYALRSTPPAIRSKYFTREKDAFRLRPEVKKLARFVRMNINDPAQLARVEPSHFVFCRNVIIYFDDDVKRRLIAGLHANLLPGGRLLVGHSESLADMRDAFEQDRTPGAVAYRKKTEAA